MVKRLAVKRIIIAAIFEFLAKAAADFDAVIGRYGNVAVIKQPVDIATE